MSTLGQGVISALVAGLILAFVSSIEGSISKQVGAINATLLEHSFAGILSVFIIIIMFRGGHFNFAEVENLWIQIGTAAILVLIGVTAIAFAIPRTGVAVGNFAMVISQVIVAVIIDAIGFGGLEKVPITIPKIIGLGLMIAGLIVVLPRN